MSTLALNANDARARSVVEQHERGIGLDGGGQSRLPSRGVGFFVHGATGRLARQATRTCGWSAPSPLLGDLRPNVHARDQPCTNRVDVLDALVCDHAAIEVPDDLVHVNDDPALFIVGECLGLDAGVSSRTAATSTHGPARDRATFRRRPRWASRLPGGRPRAPRRGRGH